MSAMVCRSQCIELPSRARWGGRYPRLGLGAVMPFLLVAALNYPGTPHELADGELERWCEVVVRDELIQVRYSIGYNAQTESTVFRQLGVAPNGPAESPADAGNPGESTPDSERVGRDELWKEAFARYMADHLQLQVDGRPLIPVRSEVVPSGRHPMCWFVALEFDAPQELSSFRLTIVDSAFPTFPGPARQALRSKSHWELRDSNAALLLVRAKAETWSGESDSAPASRPGGQIEAQLTDSAR